MNSEFYSTLQINMENSTVVSVGTGLYRNPNTENIKVSLSTPGQIKMAFNGSLKRFFNLLLDRVRTLILNIVKQQLSKLTLSNGS